ncbi:hypothetical protein PGTUg99_007138 [Puccinia graminis f. sp. tritici]|uniref:Uncharacterized protein n=1 Tax=Puccinia graminis f. sp. tritici TaxID=56615 RepID=A0A5B0PGH8_PUCGR|nr:hypothetical protein PGTUg99_007138 [Puccinia graminis f. sp. tritici]
MSTEVVRETKVLLTPNNYALWLLPMEAKLFKSKLLNIVESQVEPEEKEKETWIKQNNDAYTEIISYIGQEVLGFVSSALPATPRFNDTRSDTRCGRRIPASGCGCGCGCAISLKLPLDIRIWTGIRMRTDHLYLRRTQALSVTNKPEWLIRRACVTIMNANLCQKLYRHCGYVVPSLDRPCLRQ